MRASNATLDVEESSRGIRSGRVFSPVSNPFNFGSDFQGSSGECGERSSDSRIGRRTNLTPFSRQV